MVERLVDGRKPAPGPAITWVHNWLTISRSHSERL
jgi:hypothetical protein